MLHKDWKMGKIFAAFLRRNLLILDSNCKKCHVGYQKGFDPIVELPINYNAQCERVQTCIHAKLYIVSAIKTYLTETLILYLFCPLNYDKRNNLKSSIQLMLGHEVSNLLSPKTQLQTSSVLQ